MTKTYRKGAIGALMDEYERASSDLKLLLRDISEDRFIEILDTQTKDNDCRSTQTIITHVLAAGYGYADYIRGVLGIPASRPDRRLLSRPEVEAQLDAMVEYTVHTLEGRWEMTDDEMMSMVIDSRWGVRYDLEQLLEHAIVHILRHRRQIERLIQSTGMVGSSGV
ncbi:MAG TPA: DinB family protein [Blastocatellia bacterium]|nr:DinB family protein [Blastocatellia bacterium]